MNGLILQDEDVIKGMEKEVEGVYIPVKMSKNGNLDDKSLVDLAQLGQLKAHIERLILRMASTLKQGDVSATPLVSKDRDPCKYCDYYEVCRIDERDKLKQTEFKKQEFFDCLEAGEIDE